MPRRYFVALFIGSALGAAGFISLLISEEKLLSWAVLGIVVAMYAGAGFGFVLMVTIDRMLGQVPEFLTKDHRD